MKKKNVFHVLKGHIKMAEVIHRVSTVQRGHGPLVNKQQTEQSV